MVRPPAKPSALALSPTQLKLPVKSRLGQSTLLRQIDQVLNSSLNPELAIGEILRAIGLYFRVDRAVLVRLDRETPELVQQWPVSGAIPFEGEIRDREGGSQSRREASQFCPWQPRGQGWQPLVPSACLRQPLVVRGQWFGALTLQAAQQERSFTPGEIEALGEIAGRLELAVSMLQMQERLDQLQAAGQKQSEFLSHLHHELRTPLTAVLGFARMLQEEIYGSLNAKQKQYVSGIATSGEHLLNLVNDYLDLSKIEVNREELFLETLSVEDLCLAALSIVQPKAREQGLDLRLEIEPEVTFCTADPRRLKQILLNLLSNGIKYTEVGSVTLRVRRNRTQLEFSTIDTGIGIREADLEKLFQPFQQIHNPLSRKHKGTGLGLALSRKLAQLHGGEITVTSREGEGSCFTLHLPLEPLPSRSV